MTTLIIRAGFRATIACATFVLATMERSSAAAADADQLAYGEHLAGECLSCHRKDGGEKGAGIPPIIGLDQSYFIETMKFYRTGERPNAAMISVARSLDDAQLKALGAYLASIRPPAKQGSAKAKRGQ